MTNHKQRSQQALQVSILKLFKDPLMLMCIALIAITGCSEAQDSQVQQAQDLIKQAENLKDLDVEQAQDLIEKAKETLSESAEGALTDQAEQVVKEAEGSLSKPAEGSTEGARIIEAKSSTAAQPAVDLEGKYQDVAAPLTVSTGEKIEVLELFWFGCSHCFSLEPHVKEWLKNKPENAEFKKVPALFSKRWEFHGQAFYTMETLDVPDEAYDSFFSRIHIERKPVNSLDGLVEFLAPYDKSKQQVEDAFNSFAVDSQMRNAKKITQSSGARGVPAMIVDGKYLTSQQLSGGSTQMFDVVNGLVDKAAAER